MLNPIYLRARMSLWDILEESRWRGNDLTILLSQKIIKKNKQEMKSNKLSCIIEPYAWEDMGSPVHLLPRIHKVSSFTHHLLLSVCTHSMDLKTKVVSRNWMKPLSPWLKMHFFLVYILRYCNFCYSNRKLTGIMVTKFCGIIYISLISQLTYI